MNFELIKKLQTNEGMAYCGLTKEEQDLLQDNIEHVQIRYNTDIWSEKNQKSIFEPLCIYRIDPNWNPEPKAKWVECPIYKSDEGTHWVCEIDHLGREFSLDEFSGLIGFGGVRFEGQQRPDEWYMTPNCYIETEGKDKGYVSWCSGMPNEKLAVPVRARFWKFWKEAECDG